MARSLVGDFCYQVKILLRSLTIFAIQSVGFGEAVLRECTQVEFYQLPLRRCLSYKDLVVRLSLTGMFLTKRPGSCC